MERTTVVLKVNDGGASIEADGDAAFILMLAQLLRRRFGLEVGITALVPLSDEEKRERIEEADFRVLDESAA